MCKIQNLQAKVLWVQWPKNCIQDMATADVQHPQELVEHGE